MRTILLIILILLLLGALPLWPYSAGWGYYPGGGARTHPDCTDCAHCPGASLRYKALRSREVYRWLLCKSNN